MNKIPVSIAREDTSMEICARIARSEAHKHNCSIYIDFSGSRRDVRLIGDKSSVPYIIDKVKNFFIKDS